MQREQGEGKSSDNMGPALELSEVSQTSYCQTS